MQVNLAAYASVFPLSKPLRSRHSAGLSTLSGWEGINRIVDFKNWNTPGGRANSWWQAFTNKSVWCKQALAPGAQAEHAKAWMGIGVTSYL